SAARSRARRRLPSRAAPVDDRRTHRRRLSLRMRVAVAGHVEWIEFARVERVPAPGQIVHALEAWAEPAGGGAVTAVQLARLAGEALVSPRIRRSGDQPPSHRTKAPGRRARPGGGGRRRPARGAGRGPPPARRSRRPERVRPPGRALAKGRSG